MRFLREELKKKSVLLRSLITTSNSQRNKSSEKTPENPLPNFPSKENSNFIKEHVPPTKDDVTDFCIDGTVTKSDNTEKEKQFEKKDQIKQTILEESSTEREEHGITTKEKSEIVIPQPILAHTHTDEVRISASRSKPSEIEPPKQSEEWRKYTALITGDSMIAGLREAKLSSNKKIKVRFFPGAKTEDLMFHLIPNLKKNPENIIIHIGANDAPYKNENVLYEELKQIKDLNIDHHPDCKNIFISCPIVLNDNKKANNVLKKYIDILKSEENNVIFIITVLNLTSIEMVFILIVTGLLC